MESLLAIALGYTLGSIPFAFVLSRRRGIDLREVGSGNVGAANVLRTSGTTMAVLAMLLDAAKGSLAVLVAQRLAGGPGIAAVTGVASVVGHVYPVWLRFRGGKGVATAAGAFAVLAPGAMAVAGAVFLAVVWWTRYISVGSIAASMTLAVAAGLSEAHPMTMLGAALAAAIVVHRHRSNLVRLVAGTERRVGQRLS